MKKVLTTLLACLALMAIMSSGAYASTIASYTSGFQVQNLDSGTANISMVFYNADGSTAASVPDTIAGGGSNTYFPLPSGVNSGFNGSAVISSDKPVAAIANVIGDSTQGSSYSGFDSGSNSISLPLINKANYNIDTWFNVQNAGSSDVNVTVAYSGQPNCNETGTIKPGAAKTFNQATNTCLPVGYVGAGTVTTANASDSIVASALQVATSGLFAYNGFSTGSTNPVMPLISANVFGFHTGMQIQNQGSSSTNVTVTYRPAPGGSNGTQCTETKTIPGNGSETFTLYAFSLSGTTSSTCSFGQYFVGSAEVTANSASQNLVAIVNQTNFADKGSAYNSFNKSDATGTVVMPLIMNAYNIWTGFNVMNVGTASATVTCTYSGITQTSTATLAPNEAMSVQQVSGFPANYVGGGTCTASGGSLVGVVNQANTVASGDTTLTYEAFNQ